MHAMPSIFALVVVAATASAAPALGQTIAVNAQAVASASASASAASSASLYSNSAAFNDGFGLGSGAENQAATGQVRDANGNLTIVNGVMTGTSVSRQEGISQTGAGVGSSATAIGNTLNVNVLGNWNTVIIDSMQTNNGDQNANVSLNGKLDF